MRLLLDTHAFLWFISGDGQLDVHVRKLIEDEQNQRYLSVASLWEITIKSSLGRLLVPTPSSKLVHEHVWTNAIELLPISPTHLDALHLLPHHHKDPFDRLMIAQAIQEDLVMITKDSIFHAYGVQIAWKSS